MGQSTFSGSIRSLGGLYTQGPNAIATISAVNTVLDLSYAGKLIRITNPNATITLPATNNSADSPYSGPGPDPNTLNNMGVTFNFMMDVAAVAAALVTSGVDHFVGAATVQGTTTAAFAANPASATFLTLNGSTTGGLIGSLITVQAVPGARWLVKDALLLGSGAVATPFV